MATNNGAPGLRLQHQLFKEGRKGGLTYYPFSALVNGLKVSIDNKLASGTFSVQVDIASGSAVLDGVQVHLGSAINNLNIPVDQAVATKNFVIYLRPSRKVQLRVGSANAPTTRVDGTPLQEGDYYLHVNDLEYGDNNQTYHIGKKPFVYRYNGSAWVEDTNSSFGPPVFVGQQNYYRFAEVSPFVSSSNSNNPNFSSNPEPFVYYPTGHSPSVASPSSGIVREDASLRLAEVSLAVATLPIASTATAAASGTTVTVTPAVAEALRIIKDANGNTMPTLSITATGIPASTNVSDVSATANTITISNATTAALSNTPINITHASATYAISSPRSVVTMTNNKIFV